LQFLTIDLDGIDTASSSGIPEGIFAFFSFLKSVKKNNACCHHLKQIHSRRLAFKPK